jgi:hypothetical protein
MYHPFQAPGYYGGESVEVLCRGECYLNLKPSFQSYQSNCPKAAVPVNDIVHLPPRHIAGCDGQLLWRSGTLQVQLMRLGVKNDFSYV